MSTCISQKYIQHSKRQAAKQVWKTHKGVQLLWSESRENKDIFLVVLSCLNTLSGAW